MYVKHTTTTHTNTVTNICDNLENALDDDINVLPQFSHLCIIKYISGK